MSNIKTVTLDGGELKVEGLGGQNTEIINKSGGAVYASKFPGIVPEADGVIEIAAGDRDGLYNTNGTLYLLGTGKAELRGTDYSVNFRKPSSSAGGGGSTGDVTKAYVDSAAASALSSAKKYTDEQIGKVKDEPLTKKELSELLFEVYGPEPMMPHMDGIVGYFTPDSLDDDNNIWANMVNDYNITLSNVVQNGDELVFNTEARGEFGYPDPPLIFYMIGKINGPVANNAQNNVLYRKRNTGINYQDCSMFLKTYGNEWLGVASSNIRFGNNQAYSVVSITEDLDINPVELKAYAADMQNIQVVTSNTSKTLNDIKTRYSGVTGINDGGVTMSVKFLAFGTTTHTNEQIKANCEWLKKKYLGG